MALSAIQRKNDLKPLIENLAQSRIVMLGEASHGTKEFYQYRRWISEELIAEHGFQFIAVEGDWPPCWHVNQNIRGERHDEPSEAILRSFQRWPTWMWANTDMVDLIRWLKIWNLERKAWQQVGFYGLDVYSLFESIDEVMKVLKKVDPDLARAAKAHYACFEVHDRDEMEYAKSLWQTPEGCRDEAMSVLREILIARIELQSKHQHHNELFDAQQNARIVRNAESYYRAMILGGEDSWNVRDRHMLETLDLLLKHHGENSKCIVWAHNTHIGDYRATPMLAAGNINIGGLAREKWGGEQVALLGFGTYRGDVLASDMWGGGIRRMPVPEGRAGSYEELLHRHCLENEAEAISLWFRGDEMATEKWKEVRGHRAIGVIYDPYRERGNYVPTSLSQRYDGFIFIDETEALTPLVQKFNRHEIPETYPAGM